MSVVLLFIAIGFVVIVAPLLFSSLDEETQYRVVRRLPMLQSWQVFPTAPFQSLPTVEASFDANALALLATGNPTQAAAADNPTLTVTETSVPSSATLGGFAPNRHYRRDRTGCDGGSFANDGCAASQLPRYGLYMDSTDLE